MTLRAALALWLTDPDPVLREHARRRLAELDGHPEADPPPPLATPLEPPPEPLPLRALTCLYRDALSCCVGRCHAGRGVGRERLVRREECAACLTEPTP